MDKRILDFLETQKLMALACHNGDDVWIANVLVGVDEVGTIYFVSPEETKHSQMILKNPQVAFSFAWYDTENPANRKAIQGKGMCRMAQNDAEVEQGVRFHNKNFPTLKDQITVNWVKTNTYGSRVWILTPSYMKYWNDELFGAEETIEWGQETS